MNRRSFLQSTLAAVAAPVLNSSGVLSAAEALAQDLAAEAQALWQANYDAVLNSAFGESELHMRMLSHWHKAGFQVKTMYDKVKDLQTRLESLQEKGAELPELEEALQNAAKSEEGNGIDVDQLEVMLQRAEDTQERVEQDAALDECIGEGPIAVALAGQHLRM